MFEKFGNCELLFLVMLVDVWIDFINFNRIDKVVLVINGFVVDGNNFVKRVK